MANVGSKIFGKEMEMKYQENVISGQQIDGPQEMIKSDIMQGKTSMQHLWTMMTRLGYVYSHRNSDYGVLQDLAFAHSESLRLWEIFPYVMIIDTKYKTNRYEMALLEIVGVTCSDKAFHMGFAFMSRENEDTFTWVLRQVKGWIKKSPNVIVTNTELGLLKAVPIVYPDARHMLCLVHVERDIEDTGYMKTNDSTQEHIQFLAESRKLIRCRTMEKYETQLASMHKRWGTKWQLMEYLESTWLVYREKFVYFWTDHLLHFGNRTTNRVESEHVVLQRHLQTSNGQIDTCVKHIQTMLLDQIREVGISLDYTKYTPLTKIYELPLFRYLKGRVSDICLDKLYEIFMRVYQGKVISDCYFHWRRSSYGLPCLHEMAEIVKEGRPFLMGDVHEFWRKVQCGHVEGAGENNIDKEMVQVVTKCNTINEPEDSVPIKEPCVQPTEGISKKSKTTREKVDLEATKEEHQKAHKKSPGAPKGHRLSGQKRVGSTPDVQSDKVINVDTSDGHKRNQEAHSELPLIKTPYFNFGRGNLDTFMAIYVVQAKDVAQDGNCGFRALAETLYKGEGAWPEIRKGLFREVERHQLRYKPFLRAYSSVSEYMAKLNWLVEGMDAPKFFWMAMPESGIVFATLYQCTLVSLDYDCPMTFLPLVRQLPAPGSPPPGTILVICRLRTKLHFIPVWLSTVFPMPPVMEAWYTHRDQSVAGLDVQYASRVEEFRFLRKVHGRPTA